ncbi:MAG: hypothetical protein ACLRZ2_06145 [Veillonella sp.]
MGNLSQGLWFAVKIYATTIVTKLAVARRRRYDLIVGAGILLANCKSSIYEEILI